MKLFDVYPINEITIVKAKGSYVWDDKGEQYLDLLWRPCRYQHWTYSSALGKAIEDQLEKIAFYSNSIKFPLQVHLAEKLGKVAVKKITSFSL
jgi:acetylornithine/N-succinyldiaminopimelate aminotransferase